MRAPCSHCLEMLAVFDDVELLAELARRHGVDNITGQRQRRRMTPELASEIAQIVREDRSGKPTEAVSKELGVSHRTASRWIAAAHKLRGGLV